ncbi:zinc ribbon domain-containing protein [Planctobacterium marinum]|uniref:zinc ribbon domain-containing protein n=1 Tax=Planctobacterium marinum TaxID=1631968 RepID=UPI001E610064|nr:zinc ribbon domain-containing protein [Planctobacterium marinum]MCC2607336.1 hypothetical protein [Planctobacterium marinum]
MALLKCKECGKDVSSKAKSCPNCGAKPPKQTSFLTWLVTILIVIGFVGAFIGESSLTAEQRAARDEQVRLKREQEEVAKAEREKLKAKEDAEKKLKGFHCLSSWDGSHRQVASYVEKNMRDPDSFEHIETVITPVDEDGNHLLKMTYRGKNGFGGMSVESVVATVSNDDCNATILSSN